MKKRIELSCHTYYSKGASLISPEDLFGMAEDKEIAGIAITDNYDINAWYESYLSMRENIESPNYS